MEKITAVLITWKRQSNIPQIIESLLKWPFITQIMIHDNSKGLNVINYGRYQQAVGGENKYIYTQDDDWINPELDKVYAAFCEDPTILTHTGNKSYEADLPNNIHVEKQMACM